MNISISIWLYSGVNGVNGVEFDWRGHGREVAGGRRSSLSSMSGDKFSKEVLLYCMQWACQGA